MLPLQVYPGVTLQLVSQPALPPLSHNSVPVKMPSPQTSLHWDKEYKLCMQEKPRVMKQLMHPVLFPLSHC
jgi:hypothetical protein